MDTSRLDKCINKKTNLESSSPDKSRRNTLKDMKKQRKSIKIKKASELLYEGEVFCLPIKDMKVISGSIEFFNDPEPCMIHRSAVISRYYMEIVHWLDEINFDNGSEIEIDDVPENLKELLDII